MASEQRSDIMPAIGTPGFAEACRRQSRLIRDSETELSRAEDAVWEAASAETLISPSSPASAVPSIAGTPG